MQACAINWCCALANPEAIYCVIHGRFPKLKLKDGAPALLGGDPECTWCDGSGQCLHCDGTGECECHCGDQHECHQCHGDGTCDACFSGKLKRIERKEMEAYLAFAFDPGWQPFDVEVALASEYEGR